MRGLSAQFIAGKCIDGAILRQQLKAEQTGTHHFRKSFLYIGVNVEVVQIISRVDKRQYITSCVQIRLCKTGLAQNSVLKNDPYEKSA